MPDSDAAKKWDATAWLYDWITMGAEHRWAQAKRNFFASMGKGRILFLAAGTGRDFAHFPPGRDIVTIDISAEMIARAKPRAAHYPGTLDLRQMDAQRLQFPGNTFDQVFTACTLCSVPDPVGVLKELHRVLRPGGELRMFEHTGSKHFPFRQILDMMNLLSKRIGPSMNRDTVANVQAAGFKLQRVTNLYLDVVKIIIAAKTAGEEGEAVGN